MEVLLLRKEEKWISDGQLAVSSPVVEWSSGLPCVEKGDSKELNHKGHAKEVWSLFCRKQEITEGS